MNDCCLENPTIKDVEKKYRPFVKEAMDKLSKAFSFSKPEDEWDLRVYSDEHVENNYDVIKYMMLAWEDPYTYYVNVKPGKGIELKVMDSNFDQKILSRFVKEEDCHIKEIDYFIDSVKEFFVIKNKLRKFVNKYSESDLPLGYKREDKIKQILK